MDFIGVRATCLCYGDSPLSNFILLLDFCRGFFMQFSHQLLDSARSVVYQQLLIQERVLLIVIQLESAAFATSQYRLEGLVNLVLYVYGQVLFKIVVQC